MLIPKFAYYRIHDILLSGHTIKQYKEFEQWLLKGDFKQCECEGESINVWYGKFYYDMGYLFLTLQQLLEAWVEWQKPKTYGFSSYTFNLPKK